MYDKFKKEYIESLKSSITISRNTYNRLIAFGELEKEYDKDISQININDLLVWYINRSGKFSLGSLRPIKKYIDDYKKWMKKAHPEIVQNESNDEYFEEVIMSTIINKYKINIIHDINELIERLNILYPIKYQEELDVNAGVQLIYCLAYFGLTIKQIINIKLDDIKTNYIEAEIDVDGVVLHINHPYVVSLISCCKNIRTMKIVTLDSKYGDSNIELHQIENDYLINLFAANKRRNESSIQLMLHEKRDENKNPKLTLYYSDLEKYGLISHIKEYEKEVGVQPITSIKETLIFRRRCRKVYAAMGQRDKEAKLTSVKLKDLLCVYLAWG